MHEIGLESWCLQEICKIAHCKVDNSPSKSMSYCEGSLVTGKIIWDWYSYSHNWREGHSLPGTNNVFLPV